MHCWLSCCRQERMLMRSKAARQYFYSDYFDWNCSVLPSGLLVPCLLSRRVDLKHSRQSITKCKFQLQFVLFVQAMQQVCNRYQQWATWWQFNVHCSIPTSEPLNRRPPAGCSILFSAVCSPCPTAHLLANTAHSPGKQSNTASLLPWKFSESFQENFQGRCRNM